MTDSDADIVVAGAGHNSLLAACYLAKAGYRCLVLDARPVPGGGAATEELLLPGFGIDTCATGHTMIRVNPALLHDELGLAADYGLRYAEPDPVEQVAFPDGRQLTMWLDRDRTADEWPGSPPPTRRPTSGCWTSMTRSSTSSARPSSPLSGTGLRWRPGCTSTRAAGSGPGGGSCPRCRWSARVRQPAHPGVPALDGVPGVPAGGRAGLRGAALRADVRPPAAQLVHPDRRLRAADRRAHRLPGRSWRHGALQSTGDPAAAGRRPVHRGRTADGTEYRAGTAVLSTIHVQHLRDMAPRPAWPEEFHYGVDTYDVGVPGFATYYCATAAPQFRAENGPRSAVSAGLAGWPEDHIQMAADLRAGRFSAIRRGCSWPPRRWPTRAGPPPASTP